MANRRLKTVPLVLVLFLAAACSLTTQRPTQILGLDLGMERPDARSRLNETCDFVRLEGANQEIWKVRTPLRFTTVAVGYRDDRIRYITALVDTTQAKELIPFSRVGDLSTARAEIMPPHYRYIWDVQPNFGGSGYRVSVYGDNPEFVTMYTLSEKPASGTTGENHKEMDE